jgi:enoyl-CoA hydratase/carnithine racemase
MVELGKDKSVAAIVLAAEGPVFCAGHDLKELTRHRADADGGLAFFADTMSRCSAMMQAIVACQKPVIAAVQGMATAAGCQLVATCDLAVAAEAAQFCTPGVNIGLFCSTPMVALSRNVSRKRAMEMLLLGEMLPAGKAAEYGLVNQVVPGERLMAEALALAGKIAEKSPAVVALGKAAFYAQAEMGLSEAYDYASKVMTQNMMAQDAAEGIGAFLEKRAPKWKGC